MDRADSRRAALKFLGHVVNPKTKVGLFVVITAVAALFTFLVHPLSFSLQQNVVLFLLFYSIGLWLTEAVPPFAVGIFIIAYLVFVFGTDLFFAKDYDVNRYVSTWTNGVIWLLLGGFFLAESLRKVGLDLKLFSLTVKRFGASAEQLLMGLMLTTAFASMIMSNTATTAMMISSITPLVKKLGRKHPFSKALLVGLPAAASVGGIGTIIGSTPNAIAVGALENKGISISFLGWMSFGVPIALLLVLGFWYYLKQKVLVNMETLDLSFAKETPETKEASAWKKNSVLAILGSTVILWITTPIHQLPLSGTSALPILALTMMGIITADDVRGLAWDTLMLVAGGLALGKALVDFEIAQYAVNLLTQNSLYSVVLLLLMAVLTVLMSNVMSNTAAAAVLIPLGLALPGGLAVSAPLIISIVASCALFLPVSTPPNAIAYSTGLIDQKAFRLGGVFMAVVGITVSVLFISIYSLFI